MKLTLIAAAVLCGCQFVEANEALKDAECGGPCPPGSQCLWLLPRCIDDDGSRYFCNWQIQEHAEAPGWICAMLPENDQDQLRVYVEPNSLRKL